MIWPYPRVRSRCCACSSGYRLQKRPEPVGAFPRHVPVGLREFKLSQMKGGRIRLAGERYGLTAREKQVLAEMVEGKSNRQVATALTVSVSTVKSHVSNILSKMGVESRTAAVALALRQQGKSECGYTESGAASQAGYSCPLST